MRLRRAIRDLFGAALIALLSPGGTAQETDPDPNRPRIGLVLGGGGARGSAHVGVLQVLEDLRIPVDAIAGTSIGSIVGALYASGWSPDEMDALMTTTDWLRVLDDYPPRGELSFRRKRDDAGFLIPITLGFDFDEIAFQFPTGALGGRNVESLLEALTAHVHSVDDFDELPIPFRCVAADLADGSMRVFEAGRLAEAVRASMSLPGIFAPFEIDGRSYVDGGIVDNVPVDVARAMGVDIVIAVDVGTPLAKPEQLGSLLGVTDQVIGIMMQQNIARQLDSLDVGDVLITPELDEITVLDFALAELGIERGREAASRATDRLAPLGVDETTWGEFLTRQRRERPIPRIHEVRIDNRSRLSNELIREVVRQPDDAPLDLDTLTKDVARLGGYRVFDRISFSLVDREDEQRDTDQLPPADLLIRADDRDLGPHYLQFGLQLANDFRGDSDFNAALRHTWLPINELGGEWRNELQVGAITRASTEFYQPVTATQEWFVVPRIEYVSERIPLLLDGVPIASADVDSLSSSLAVGRTINDVAEFRTGYAYVESQTELNLGIAGGGETFPFLNSDGYLFTRLTVDSLDSLNYPTTGWFGYAEWRYGNDDLGGDADYSALATRLQKPLTFGDTTFLTNAEFGWSWDPASVVNNVFRLGGFTRLSGLEPNELIGDSYALGSMIVYHRLSRPATTFSSAFYVGASAEVGNVWNVEDSISLADMRVGGSLFVGADTLLGPVYLGIGVADEGRQAAYLYLGQQF